MTSGINQSAIIEKTTFYDDQTGTTETIKLNKSTWETTLNTTSLEQITRNCSKNVEDLPQMVSHAPSLCITSGPGDGMTQPAIIGVGVAASIVFIAIIVSIVLVYKVKCKKRKNDDNKTSLWDDNMTLSYINPHIDMSKEIDTDLASLDDDSFLNSLDNMNFVNLWSARTARGIKHTKF